MIWPFEFCCWGFKPTTAEASSDINDPSATQPWVFSIKLTKVAGSGGGKSGRAMAFCLGRPGLNPGSDFGFFSSALLSIDSHWVLGFF